MRKILSLFAALLFAGSMWATDVSITFANKGLENGVQYTDPFELDDNVTITFAGGGNDGKYYDTGSGIRTYGGGTVTIATKSGTISQIVFTYDGSNAPSSNVANVGTYSSSNHTWTGNAASIILTRPSGSGHWRMKSATVSYTPAGGTPTCATPTFTPVAGKYLGAQSVTIASTTEGATIYYTTDGTAPTTSSATAQPIAVSATTTIKAIAVKEGMTNSAEATAAYTIVNVDHAGTAADPYSVADARTVIDAGVGLTNVYATGIVSEIVTEYSSTYHNISYNISADGLTTSNQLQAYRGKGKNGANFTSADDVRVGDEVIVYGTLKKHEETYEFDQNNQLYSLVARTPVLDIDDVENLSTEDADLAVSDLTVDKDGSEGAITLVSGDETKATIVNNKIHPVAAGDVTITANIAASGIYRAASTTFNVHVIEICHNLVTLSKGTPEHGTFTLSRAAGEYPTCEGEVTVVVTPSAAEHYHVKAIVAPNSASISEPDGDGKYTVTYAKDTNAESEINVTFEEDSKSTVTWSVNGNTDLTTEVYDGEKPEFPATPSAFDATSTAFYGWATAAWSGKAANLNEKTVYIKAADMPEVDGAVTYYAVFAKADTDESESSTTYELELTGAGNFVQNYNERSSNADADEVGGTKTFNVGFTSSGVMKSTNSGNPIQFRKSGSGAGVLYNTTNLGTINSITYGDGSTNNIASTYIGPSQNPTSAGTGGYFEITNGSSVSYITSITINFTITTKSSVTTYSDYMTTATSTTALDNSAVEGKAVKFIKNGQLFIEKAGVRYNVMGQIIK